MNLECSKEVLLKSRYADPTVDFAFKRIFGTEKYKQATINLLNCLLPECNIVNVSFLNSELLGDTGDSRKSYIDVLCEDTAGNLFIIEMQNARQEHFLERAIFYASKLISMTPPQGRDWDYSLPPTYVVAFLNFDLKELHPKQDIASGQYILHYSTTKTDDGQKLPGSTEYIFLGLKDFNKSVEELQSYPEKWLYSLHNTPRLEEFPQMIAEDAEFASFIEAVERAGFSKEDEQKYTTDMMNDWDIANAKRLAVKEGREEGRKAGREEGREEGRKEGREEGRKEGRKEGRMEARLEVAKKLLEAGIDIDVIIESTGLEEKIIKSLQ